MQPVPEHMRHPRNLDELAEAIGAAKCALSDRAFAIELLSVAPKDLPTIKVGSLVIYLGFILAKRTNPNGTPMCSLPTARFITMVLGITLPEHLWSKSARKSSPPPGAPAPAVRIDDILIEQLPPVFAQTMERFMDQLADHVAKKIRSAKPDQADTGVPEFDFQRLKLEQWERELKRWEEEIEVRELTIVEHETAEAEIPDPSNTLALTAFLQLILPVIVRQLLRVLPEPLAAAVAQIAGFRPVNDNAAPSHPDTSVVKSPTEPNRDAQFSRREREIEAREAAVAQRELVVGDPELLTLMRMAIAGQEIHQVPLQDRPIDPELRRELIAYRLDAIERRKQQAQPGHEPAGPSLKPLEPNELTLAFERVYQVMHRILSRSAAGLGSCLKPNSVEFPHLATIMFDHDMEKILTWINWMVACVQGNETTRTQVAVAMRLAIREMRRVMSTQRSQNEAGAAE